MIDTANDIAVEQEPESIAAARAEQAELLDGIRGIEAQLGQGYKMTADQSRRMGGKEYADWRRRAVDARRYQERRYRFIKHWVADQVAKPGFVDDRGVGGSVSGELRGLAKRIGGVESIAVAAIAFVRVPSDANMVVLTELVKLHAEKVGL